MRADVRKVRLLGPCPCCKRDRAEIYVCVCTHKVVYHRVDDPKLKHQRCTVSGCPCRQYAEAPNQPDVREPSVA